MPIQIGDTLPSVELKELKDGKPQVVTTEELFAGKNVVLFALPGAFTPTCSKSHLPMFELKASELKAKNIDEIICLSVNDAYVMNAWGESLNIKNVRLIADGSADFTQAVDLVNDRTKEGMGIRSKRYAIVVKDGVVEWIGLDEGTFEFSTVDAVLANL